MTLVDSSVWIDYLRGIPTPQSLWLKQKLGAEFLAIGDLILTEVLQGIDADREFERVRRLLAKLPIIEISSEQVAIQAAQNYRFLRSRGITIRKTVDTLIATRCIYDGIKLLYSDRDFEPFTTHLGLLTVSP